MALVSLGQVGIIFAGTQGLLDDLPVDAVRAFEVNALDYLLKPVAPARLARAVERLSRPNDGTSGGPVAPKLDYQDRLFLRLDDRMADLDQPVTVKYQGKSLFAGRPQRTIATMIKTLAGRGDPRLMFDAEVVVDLPATKK